MAPTLHPHVIAMLPEIRERRERGIKRGDFEEEAALVEEDWLTSPLSHSARGSIDRMAMPFELDAVLALAAGDSPVLASSCRNASAFRSIAFRWKVFLIPHIKGYNLPLSAWDTIKATNPAILGQWDEAKVCAQALVEAAHINQVHHSPEARAKSWGKGTIDALLIYLLSSAFDIPTHYEPVNPVVAPYRELLEHWRTTDQAQFRKVMQAAAEYHLQCCGDSTDDVEYDFDWYFEQVFPLELLAIQALRRRDGLHSFDTGHALIDAPWAMLRELPAAPLHPMIARVDARLRKDYPNWR